MKYCISLILLLITHSLFSQYQGPVPAITSGHGANGTSSVSIMNLTNDHWAAKDIFIYYPTGTTTPIPTIFYSHAYGGNDTANQIETLNHFASKGYAVVFVPYKTFGATIPERYLTLYDGFIKAARNLTSIIDTTKIGFYGHSFGGGATPQISYRLFTENNWGANGKFIYCSAPWYSYELGSSNLTNFPTDCNMITVLYNDDATNDHRMGMDIFNNIAIDDSIKDCIFVKNDTITGYAYDADHTMPTQYNGNSEFNALDYYVTFRLLDALADYSFTGNLTAKDIALGNGSASQTNMGGQLSQLTVTNNPAPIYPETKYLFPCSSITNERQVYCQSTSITENSLATTVNIFPNPTSNKIYIETPQNHNLTISLFDVYGKLLLTVKNKTEIDLSNFSNGVYFLKFEDGKRIKIIKE